MSNCFVLNGTYFHLSLSLCVGSLINWQLVQSVPSLHPKIASTGSKSYIELSLLALKNVIRIFQNVVDKTIYWLLFGEPIPI